MTPEEILGKFVSGRMMIKEARYVDEAWLNEEEMALIIKRFKTALKGRKEHPKKNKTKGKRSCFKCGKVGHFIANCPKNDSD